MTAEARPGIPRLTKEQAAIIGAYTGILCGSPTIIAEDYGITAAMVCRIGKRKAWKSLPEQVVTG